MNKTTSQRAVSKKVQSIRAKEGGGFYVRRPFPNSGLSLVDPFLLFDHMERTVVGPGQAKGAPDHPHRGFETVTYMLEGGMEHKDSAGHSGQIGPGDVQWMTAGAGVVHSEMPFASILDNGGVMHGFQIWVNLPSRDKMMAPRYQDIPADRIPLWVSADGAVNVRVIAGDVGDKKAVIDTRTPIVFLHIKMQPGATFRQSVDPGFNVLAYVIDGAVQSGGQKADTSEMLVFLNGGDYVELNAPSDSPADVLFLAGAPLNEPVARWGPFVMNTDNEIQQAFADYQAGRMGEISH